MTPPILPLLCAVAQSELYTGAGRTRISKSSMPAPQNCVHAEGLALLSEEVERQYLQRRSLLCAVCIAEHVGGACCTALCRECLPEQLQVILSVCHRSHEVRCSAQKFCHHNQTSPQLIPHACWEHCEMNSGYALHDDCLQRTPLSTRQQSTGFTVSGVTCCVPEQSRLHRSPQPGTSHPVWWSLSFVAQWDSSDPADEAGVFQDLTAGQTGEVEAAEWESER